MKYLFRGAWTHGNPKHVGELLKEVDSYDITSSYIYTMFTDLFPMSKFKDAELTPEEMSHFTAILQKPESVSCARQALDDYVRIIREESARRSGSQEMDPVLAAKEKYKFKKGYGGKNS